MFRLARSLLLADVVTPEALAKALFFSATRGMPLVRALLATQAIDERRLEEHLERDDAPCMRRVAGVPRLVQRLPPGLCERLLALPVRHDPLTGTVDVAVVDTSDPHPAAEIGHWLQVPVRTVRASVASLEAALLRSTGVTNQGLRALAPPIWLPPRAEAPRAIANTPPHGSPTLGADPDVRNGFRWASDAPNPRPDPNIPFALTRKSFALAETVAVHANDRSNERPDPVLDLRRRATVRPIEADAPEPPVTVRGPFLRVDAEFTPATASPSKDVATILEEISAATERDAILELLLVGAGTIARRAAVLAVKRGALIGWACSPELAERAAFRTVYLSAAGTALAPALDRDGAHFVRIPFDSMHAPLLWVMKTPPEKDVALVAVRIEGRPVAVVLADQPYEPSEALRRLEELSMVAGVAMARALRNRRKKSS